MNYSFQSGLFFRSGLLSTTRSKLDFSRFGPDTISRLNEYSLDERIGLNGGEAIENYGTVYYNGYADLEGVPVSSLFINGPINWNSDLPFTLKPEAAVQANINRDADKDGLGLCQERFSEELATFNEWVALDYEKGNIGTAAVLIPEYPAETYIDIDNTDLDVDILSITDGIQTIDIDVKPGSDPNSINCKNAKDLIPVSILTTETFDATTVDHTSVTFQGASEFHKIRRTGEYVRHEEDIDLDGDLDLILHFQFGDTSLTCESTEGFLFGKTHGGLFFQGTDSVRATP